MFTNKFKRVKHLWRWFLSESFGRHSPVRTVLPALYALPASANPPLHPCVSVTVIAHLNHTRCVWIQTFFVWMQQWHNNLTLVVVFLSPYFWLFGYIKLWNVEMYQSTWFIQSNDFFNSFFRLFRFFVPRFIVQLKGDTEAGDVWPCSQW